MKKNGFIFLLLFATANIFAQWKYPNAENIINDVIITYEVVYDRVLTEVEKKHPLYKKEIVVAFNKDKLLEKTFSNSSRFTHKTIYNYNDKVSYNLCESCSSKVAIKSKFKNPIKKATLLKGRKEKLVGFNCLVYKTRIKGEFKEIFTTKTIGLRYNKFFMTEGFLLKYSSYDKYLGAYTVTAKKIHYTKLPETTYSISGYPIRTNAEQKEYIAKRKFRSSEVREKAIEKIGEKSPKYSLRSITGKKFKSKNLLGKVVVFNFWYSTCPPCKKEIPYLNKLKEKFKDKNVEFIAVSLDSEYKIVKFLRKHPFKYNQIEDGRWLADRFDVKLYPSNIIIDTKGNFQFYKIGYKKDITEAMEYTINKYLND